MSFLFLHIYELTLYLKVCLTTATDKLFDRTTCLLHKNKGIPLSDLLKYKTNVFAGFFTFPFFAHSVKREVANNVFKVFDTTRQWNLIELYRLQSGQSKHCFTAQVIALPKIRFESKTTINSRTMTINFKMLKSSRILQQQANNNCLTMICIVGVLKPISSPVCNDLGIKNTVINFNY